MNAEFLRWFGESKVVDANGDPRIVYHGTDADFSVFEHTEDIGFHFGGVQAAAARADLADPDEGGGLVMPVFLRIVNPLRLHDLHTWDSDDVASALARAGVLTPEQAETFAGYNDREMVRDAIAAKDYDGIVYDNQTEGGGDSYIAFDGAQIKSAIGNSGAYDPESADITDRNGLDSPVQRERMRA